jgi:hypothetical protein
MTMIDFITGQLIVNALKIKYKTLTIVPEKIGCEGFYNGVIFFPVKNSFYPNDFGLFGILILKVSLNCHLIFYQD